MNVLLISTNRNRQPLPVLPLGACIVAEAAVRAGHRVRLLDLMFARDPAQAVKRELRDFPPDVVGLSVRNIDNNNILQPRMLFLPIRSIVDLVRRETSATVVLGGAAATVMPEPLLRYSRASLLALGDGEVVFPALLSALERKEDPRRVRGVAWLDGGTYRRNGAPALHPLAGNIIPDFHRWLDVRPYRSGMTAIPIQTKRGCAFDCVYCTYSVNEGRQYRIVPTGAVVEGIRRYLARGWRDLEFVDNVFNSPREQAVELCRSISASGLKPRLQTLELNPELIDDDLLAAMEAAGFVGVGITPESASDGVLGKIGKNFTAREVWNAARIIRRHRIPCVWIFMLGGPGETRETVRETLAFAKECLRENDTAFFNIGIRIYPGTRLEAMARQEGMLHLSAEEMLSPVFYLSPEVEGEWLMRTVRRAAENNVRIICQDTFSLSYLSGLLNTLQRFGVSPPAWRYTGRLRRALQFFGVKT